MNFNSTGFRFVFVQMRKLRTVGNMQSDCNMHAVAMHTLNAVPSSCGVPFDAVRYLASSIVNSFYSFAVHKMVKY